MALHGLKSLIIRFNTQLCKNNVRYLRVPNKEKFAIEEPPRLKQTYRDEGRYLHEFDAPDPVEDKRTGFEESKAEWRYVERLLPKLYIPTPPNKGETPSGWRPQTAEATNLPYYVNRTRNHLLPVYLENRNGGSRRLTLLRHIEGDIWLLVKDIQQYLEAKYKKEILIQVHEPSGLARFKGDYVEDVRNWLYKTGF